MSYHAIIAGLLGMAVSLFTTAWILGRWRNLKLWQLPRESHHTHKAAIPRFGGAGLVVAFLCVETYLWITTPVLPARASLHPSAILGSLLIFGLGLWDDVKPLGPKRKLAGQALISAALCWSGVGIESLKLPFSDSVLHLGGWGMLVTVIWLVGMTNLINFMDGMDGLAAGVCLMMMLLLGYVGHETGGLELEAAGLAGALLAFLYFNLPPARIYLGDGGAYFLGFQIGLFALLNSHKGEVCAALAAPLLVLTLPILDTVLAILRRGLRGLPICRADRCHLHHRLLRSGLSRGKALLVFYGLTLIFLALWIGVYRSHDRWSPALLGFMMLMLVVCACGFQFRRRWLDVRRSITDSLSMREPIRYALCLSRLLEMEARRRAAVEELWPQLVAMADRLGFVSVRLTLSDGSRSWDKPGFTGLAQPVGAEGEDTRFGRLELAAPASTFGSSIPGTISSPAFHFEMLSELVVEAWAKAVLTCFDSNPIPLAFSSPNKTLRIACRPQRLRPSFPSSSFAGAETRASWPGS